MADVTYERATRHYSGTPAPAVDGLNLDVADGEFVVLVGPSGSGKSTALRMVAGLEDVDEGRVLIGGDDVSRTSPKDRDIAMVFQTYALYPHMSVADNLGFALKRRGVSSGERQRRVAEAARLLDLEPLLDRRPRALSGGQRQRVAMGRAIVREPAVFLMDEPLSNLDAQLRVETRANIAALQARLGTTTLYVTHDQVEAMTMGHRVAVLRDGVLQQVDTPRRIYDAPRNAFVAGFIGSPSMNLREAPLDGEGAVLGGLTVPLERAVRERVAALGLESVLLGIRPEALDPVGEDDEGIPVTVDVVEELGADVYVYGHLPGEELTATASHVVVRLDGRAALRSGDVIRVRPRPGAVHVFHPDDGARLA
ncbi:MAG: ABC transporter ATP-binding protein [Thermoleophilia bacterium]